jgi:hypothetical protein
MTERYDSASNAEQPEGEGSNADLDNLLFTANAEYHNERINELTSQYVPRVYTNKELFDGEIHINTDMTTRMDELSQQYEELGLYSDQRVGEYMAQKQVFYDHLAEYDLRSGLIDVLTREDSDTEAAPSQLYLHELVDRYKMEIGWHRVVSTLIKADITTIPGEQVAIIHDIMDLRQENDRKSIMDTILAVDGGEEYTNVTGQMQDISQHEVLVRAWAIAVKSTLPNTQGELDQVFRRANREVLVANLDATNMSEEKKAEAYDILSWLL